MGDEMGDMREPRSMTGGGSRLDEDLEPSELLDTAIAERQRAEITFQVAQKELGTAKSAVETVRQRRAGADALVGSI